MNPVQLTCATSALSSPDQKCQAAADFVKPSDAPLPWLSQSVVQHNCTNHHDRLESQAIEEAIHAFWRPLLIRSRNIAGRP
jgi:hypothetical protein